MSRCGPRPQHAWHPHGVDRTEHAISCHGGATMQSAHCVCSGMGQDKDLRATAGQLLKTMGLTRQSPYPPLPPVSFRHSEGGSTGHSLRRCTCIDTQQRHCLSPNLAAAGLRLAAAGGLRGRSRETGEEACRYMLRVALQLQQATMVACLAGPNHSRPGSCSLGAERDVCLPQNHRLVTGLVAACEQVGLLAIVALVPLEYTVRALEKLLARLQGLVDILQVSQVCAGECTLRSHRSQGLETVLRSCISSPGHPGRYKEGQTCPWKNPDGQGESHATLRMQGSLLSSATSLPATQMLTMRSPKGLQYPGSNFSSSLNVLMPVWKERMQGPSHCKMRPAFEERHRWQQGAALRLHRHAACAG